MDICCPQCNARYVIDEAALAATGGQARCYLCGHVFDVRQQALTEPAPDELADELDVARMLQQLRPDQPRPAAPAPAAAPPEAEVEEAPPTAAVTLEQLPALDIETTLAAPRRRGWRLLGGGLLVVLLLALAAAQLAWAEREHLLKEPRSRAVLAWACSLLSCSLPEARDPGAFVVLERSLAPATDAAQALALRVQFSNRAPYAQPLPLLQLSLFDNQQRVLARRSFRPREYLQLATAPQRLVEPEEVVTIELLLEDLGPRATGFELAFY